MNVYLIATLDTKGHEIGFIRDRLGALGVSTQVVDTGCQGAPAIAADISREKVFAAAGTTLQAVRDRGDRGEAVTRAAEGVTTLIRKLHAEKKVAGVLGIGGSAGTTIATSAMRVLPVGVPKVMVSTLASGDVRKFVGDKDILMLNSIVDILGLNRISRAILSQAAHAMAGMVKFAVPTAVAEDKPLVTATMFGVTTPCVERAKGALEQAGYEVLVFHATGNGGQAMESLIRDGLIAGVLDITTTELADEFAGGFLTAGPTRLTAAGDMGVPQVISVGATDMANFWGMESVPEKFRSRKLHKHNPSVTLMRTTPQENAAIGRDIGAKASRAQGPTTIMLPLQGVSAIDREGQPFNDPAARTALYDAIRESRGQTELVEMDCHINDPAFADAAARKLIELMGTRTVKVKASLSEVGAA